MGKIRENKKDTAEFKQILIDGKQRLRRIMKATVPQMEQWLRKRCDFPEQRSMEKVHKEIKDR